MILEKVEKLDGMSVKESIQLQFDIIAEANKNINIFRAKCTHPHSSNRLWSWRIGKIDERMICDDCGIPTDKSFYEATFGLTVGEDGRVV